MSPYNWWAAADEVMEKEMENNATSEFISWIERLCGQSVNPTDYAREQKIGSAFPSGGLGRSQLNEILLAHQLDRIDDGLFHYIFRARHVNTLEEFKDGINEYRKDAMIKYGNFKYAYKTLSRYEPKKVVDAFSDWDPKDKAEFCERSGPVTSSRKIAPSDTYYLGYLVEKQIEKSERETKGSPEELDRLRSLKEKMEKIRRDGRFNHECYLDSDYLDVYVATSMRHKHDFWNVARTANNIFSDDLLKNLNIRHFDPTQAYCVDRIDKGLVEALMLKRAECTIYMAGETETLGKDSELAATLAQGKPVIAYVPQLNDYDNFVEDYVTPLLSDLFKDQEPIAVALDFLQIFYPQGAWENRNVRNWLNNAVLPEFDEVVRLIFENAKQMYDDRADTLREHHPLGLQVHLETGVAHGVLVARSVSECARLVRGILLRTLEFEIEEQDPKQMGGSVLLREKSTRSIFRVVTGDNHLTNSYWNFYLQRSDQSTEGELISGA